MNDEIIADVIRSHGITDAQEISRRVLIADGRIECALECVRDEAVFHTLDEYRGELENLGAMNTRERLSFAEEMSQNVPQLIDRLHIWIQTVRRQAQQSQDIAAGYARIETLEQTVELLQTTNAHARLLAERLVLSL